MNHFEIIKRAFQITWRYRMLWVFGIILALTTQGANGGSGNSGAQFSGGDFGQGQPPGQMPQVPIAPEDVWLIVAGVIAVVLALVCVVLLLTVVGLVARYVATTALIRMVDHYEDTGEKVGFRAGWRMGWSNDAWRLFLIDLLINVPLFLLFLLLIVAGLVPLGAGIALGLLVSPLLVIPVAIAFTGFIFLVVLLGLAISFVVRPIRTLSHRACVLEDRGIVDALRAGIDLVRSRALDVFLMWLLLIGLYLLWTLAMFVVGIAILLAALLVGGLPALLVGGLLSLVVEGAVPWIAAAVVGALFFLLVLIVPLTWLGGLVEVFESTTWTLTFRELRTPGAVAAGAPAVPPVDVYPVAAPEVPAEETAEPIEESMEEPVEAPAEGGDDEAEGPTDPV